MTSDGLGEMFEGDSADTLPGKFPASVDGGTSGGSSVPPSALAEFLYEVTLLNSFGYDATHFLSERNMYHWHIKMLPLNITFINSRVHSKSYLGTPWGPSYDHICKTKSLCLG